MLAMYAPPAMLTMSAKIVSSGSMTPSATSRGTTSMRVGEIAVAGPDLAGSLTDLGLIDEYRLYLHPIVLGRGKPFFAGPRPPLRLGTTEVIGEDVVRLTYVPA